MIEGSSADVMVLGSDTSEATHTTGDQGSTISQDSKGRESDAEANSEEVRVAEANSKGRGWCTS